MTLEAYLDAASISRAEFAEKVGVSKQAVQRCLAGKRTPNKEIMAEIAAVTSGAVTANDFFGITI